MLLLHIIPSLDPVSGGTASAVQNLVLYSPEGVSAEVLTVDDASADFLRDLPIRVHALGPLNSTYGSSSILVAWLKENLHRFDGVLVHGLWQAPGLAILRSIRRGTPYVVFAHGMLDPWFKRQYPLKHLKKWVYWLLVEYWVLRKAHRVLFTTDIEGDLAKQSFWLHHWHPLTVSLGTIPPPKETREQHSSFITVCPGVAGRRFILFLGRIHVKKGCDHLIKAFSRVADSDPGLDLVIAGPDQVDWARKLKLLTRSEGIEGRIHWPGMLKGDAKWGAFRGCEAFVLPSHQENFGIAIAEALACGKPVLISDKVNIAPDIVRDYCGYVEEDTLEGTLRLFERWIGTSSNTRRQMGESSLKTFDRRYRITKVARSVAGIFLDLKR